MKFYYIEPHILVILPGIKVISDNQTLNQMDVTFENSSPEPSVCENCSASVVSTQKFCSQCSFPANGSDDEKRNFRLHVSSRKRFLSDAQDKIKSSKIIIFGLAGLFFLVGLIMGFGKDDFVSMVTNIFLCIVFLILAAWCTHNPFGATLTALIIYGTLLVVNAFVDPTTILSGIILKVIIITALVKGIRSAQEAQKYFSELEKLKAAPVNG